jgi:hypothetical protein
VLTSSYFFAGGDDNTGSSGVSKSDMDTMDMAFQDAAVYGITVCICTGDSGSNAGVADEYVHVVSPANDPWVLAVGGTTIGQYQPSDSSLPLMWEEFVWNDALTMPPNATGGGVSDYFPVPDYQTGLGIPNSLNLVLDPSGTFNTTGRGIPDVAGNASLGSGYLIYLGDKPAIAAGTSSSTPLWAGLIAMLNSNLGFNLGFVNPILYGLGESAFNPINPLWPDPDYPQLTSCPADNGINGIPGYPAGPGWDACTGLGSPNGNAILTAIQNLARPDAYILGGYQSASIIISDPSTSPPTVIPIGGFPGGVWDTLLKPDTDYLFFVVVTNDSPAPASGVEVRFWGIPYGIATYGYMIGTPQTVAIPAYSSITVLASAPFVSGDVGEHLCAAVTIYNPQSGCTTQILNAADIPDPGPAGSHGCTAWRNTDSMTAAPASHFTFNLGMGHVPIRYPGPVIIRMKPIHIPFYWNRLTKVTGIAQALRFIGAENALPLYLLPEIIKDFPQIWLGTTLEVSEGVKIERAENNQWQIFPAEQSEKTSFKISGKIPGSARPRDIVLIEISANYPAAGNRPARRVMFYETIHITDRLKK